MIKVWLSWQNFCCNKHNFVATNMSVATKLLSWQKWYLWHLPPLIVMRWTAPLLNTYMEGLNAELVQGGLAVKQNNIPIHHVSDHCVAKLQLAGLLISVTVLQKPVEEVSLPVWECVAHIRTILQKPVLSGQFTSVRVCCAIHLILQKPVIRGQFTSVRVCCEHTPHTSKTCHKWSVYQCESALCT